jgi:hypothetical protein
MKSIMKSIQLRSIGAEIKSGLVKSSYCIALVALLLLGTGMNVSADTRTWSSGANVFWDKTTTWAEASVPTASDDVSLNVGSTLTITNAAAANSVTLSPVSGSQTFRIFNGTSGNTGSLVVGGGFGTIQRSPTGGTTPNVTVALQSATDLGTNGLLNCFSLEDYATTIDNSFWHCYLTTTFDIYSQVQMSVGNGSSSKDVFFHQAGGTVKCPQGFGSANIGYGITFAMVSSYGTGLSNVCNYYLDNGTIQANRIGSGNGDGNNFTVSRWYGQGNLFLNNGTIQPYNTTLYFQNEYSFHTYTNGAGQQKDMQIGTWMPFTVVLSTNGTHTLTTALATGGYADIYVTPSVQFVDSTDGPGSLIKDGAFANLRFCGGDNPYATNTFSGTTTVNGGQLIADFNSVAGSAASSTGTNVLLNAFSPNSKVVLNGGNFTMTARANGVATNFTGASFSGVTANLLGNAAFGIAPGAQVHNTNLPAGAYLRQKLSAQYFSVSHLATNSGSFTGQAFTVDAASFVSTQYLAGVTLQSNGTLKVSPNGGSGAALICGPIDGGGSLTVDGGGWLTLTGTNTYTGNTIITWGGLALGANASIATTPSIYVSPYQNFDVTAQPGGYTIQSGQTISGFGNFRGNLTIAGTLTIGANSTDIQGDLFTTNLTLTGTTILKLNKDNAGRTNDVCSGIATLNYGGTLIVTNLSVTSLALGDSFRLFSANNTTNDFATKVLPVLDSGLAWIWTPTNGTLSVGNAVTLTPTNMSFTVTGSTLSLSWPASYLGWYVQSNSVSLANPAMWFDVPGSQSATNLSITINPANPQTFYRMRSP